MTTTRRSSRGHSQGLNLLKRYVAKQGWDRFTKQTKVSGFHLGHWVTCRRIDYRRKRLPAGLVKDLEAIPGGSWDPLGDRHRRNVQLLTRISEMSCLTLACNLRQPFENKGFDAFHAEVTGQPNG